MLRYVDFFQVSYRETPCSAKNQSRVIDEDMLIIRLMDYLRRPELRTEPFLGRCGWGRLEGGWVP